MPHPAARSLEWLLVEFGWALGGDSWDFAVGNSGGGNGQSLLHAVEHCGARTVAKMKPPERPCSGPVR